MKYEGARDDEVFVGNTPTSGGVPDYLSSLKTARLGDQALDIDGNKIDPAYMRPLFIGRSEAKDYDRIMMNKTFPGRPVW